MLVLTRKEGETIVIDDQIKITVVRTRGRAIRLAIEAPRDMRVLRGELAPTHGRLDSDGCRLCSLSSVRQSFPPLLARA